jgi:hypothetical protein
MQHPASAKVQLAETIRVETVINITAVGAATAFSNQGLIPKALEMIRHQVGRLLDKVNQLRNAVITSCQSSQKLPSQLMG